MTSTIPTNYGDLVVWTTADPQDLPTASAAMQTSVANALNGILQKYTTTALLLAASPARVGYYTADDAIGGFFYWNGAAWTLTGTPVVANTGVVTAPQSGWTVRATSTGRTYEYVDSAWSTTTDIVCTLGKSANQNLSTSLSPLTWDVEISDRQGMHNNSSNTSRIVAVEPGLYEVSVQMYNNNTSGLGTAQARINGSTDIPGSFTRRDATAPAAAPLAITFACAMSLNDYVEVLVMHSTATGAIAGGTTSSAATITMKRIGAA